MCSSDSSFAARSHFNSLELTFFAFRQFLTQANHCRNTSFSMAFLLCPKNFLETFNAFFSQPSPRANRGAPTAKLRFLEVLTLDVSDDYRLLPSWSLK